VNECVRYSASGGSSAFLRDVVRCVGVWRVVCTWCVKQQGTYLFYMHAEIPFFEPAFSVGLHVARIIAGNSVLPSVSLCRSCDVPYKVFFFSGHVINNDARIYRDKKLF
jgi:hypothetical protein